MTFHAVCNTALHEWKHPAKFYIWNCSVYKVIVSKKKSRLWIIETSNFFNESQDVSSLCRNETLAYVLAHAHLLNTQTWENVDFRVGLN